MITSAVNFLKIRILLLGLCTLPVFTKANIQIVYSKQADEGKCNGVIVVEATGNAGPFDITLNGEVVAQNFSGKKYFTGLCSGAYSIVVTNSFKCETPLNTVIHECGQISVNGLQAGVHPPSACGEQDGSFGFGHGVSATGGTAPYSFILKDHKGDILPMEEYGGWENLGAGGYHLTIIDGNGCRGEEEFTIEGEDIEVSYGASPECEHSANGYIWAYAYAPSSGSAEETYYYEWSTGDEFDSSEGILLEGLAAGTYTVTVSTENGACTYTETIIVEGLVSEAPLSVEAEVINTCPQYPSGYIGLRVGGGVPRPNSTHFTYTIQWEDHNSLYNQRRYGLEAGDYTVTVTDLCGNTVTETIWSGILDTEFKSEAGACYVTATCGNGEHWNPPNSGDLYWDNHDGRVENDAADIIECWKDQICEINWTWADPFGITHHVFNPPEIVDSRVPFDVTRKYIGPEQPECTYL